MDSEQQFVVVEQQSSLAADQPWESLETDVTTGIEPSILQTIMEQSPDNTKCFDCQSDKPQMASLNNGIFICINCAAIHSGYEDSKISELKSITLDPWTELDVRRMQLGGNRRLAEYFQSYGLQDEDSEERLKSEAADFYRSQLTSLVQGETFEEQAPNLHRGRTMKKPKAPTLLGKGLGLLAVGAASVKKASDTVGLTDEIRQGKNYVMQKAEEHKVAEKATAAGQTVKKGAQTAATFTKEKAQDLQVKEKAQALGNTVKQGASNVYMSAQDGTLKDKTKETAAKAGAFIGGLGQSLLRKRSSAESTQKEAHDPSPASQPAQSQFSNNARGEPSYADHNPYEDYI